jgi:hypothetical protein
VSEHTRIGYCDVDTLGGESQRRTEPGQDFPQWAVGKFCIIVEHRLDGILKDKSDAYAVAKS